MRTKFYICIVFAALVLTSCGKKDDAPNWKLVWSDEFDSDELDLSKWNYQTGNAYNGWGNNEAQYYKKDNVAVEDGYLTITAKREKQDEFKYTSGRIRTMADDDECLFQTQYGKIEARIALTGDELSGLWPAFWIMPVDNAYGSWPNSGEIDIMEARGRLPDVVNGTIHFGESIPNNKSTNMDYTFEDGEDITSFHVYAVEWDTDEIKWTVDGEEYFRTSNWYTGDETGITDAYPAPFNKPFYIILNLAVGGDYDGGILPENDMKTAAMKVDYVRVYENQDGYSTTADKNKNDELDKKSFTEIGKKDNYIEDTEFANVNLEGLTGTPDYVEDKWFFITKEYFDGKAEGEIVEEDGNVLFHCIIHEPGEKRYSIQLQHVVPFVKGYTYTVEFDARSTDNRMIAFQPIGIKNDETVSYSAPVEALVGTKLEHYYYTFTMKEDTDISGIIEFNFGNESADVFIGNIKTSNY